MPQPPGGPGRRPAPFRCLPSGNRADELCALVARPGDARVADQLPPPPVRRGDLPSVVGTARVPEGRSFAEGFRDHLRGPLAGDVVHLDLDAEGLVFHGVCSFRPAAASPARPGCALWAVSRLVRTSITLPGRKVNGFFCEKGGRASLYMRVGAGKNPGFFSPGGFCRPGGHTDPPPGTAAGHTFRLCSGEVRADGTSPLCREEVRRAAHFSTLLWRSRRAGLCAQPPGRGVPGRGWSDPWVCLAETAPPSRVNFRQIRGWGYRPQKA